MRVALKRGAIVAIAAFTRSHQRVRDAVLVAVVELRDHARTRAARRSRAASRASITAGSGSSSPGIAQPFVPSYASAHQPSSTLSWSTPLKLAFIPLVPLASIGRRGRLTQTSQPLTSCRATDEVVVLEEDHACRDGEVADLQVEERLQHALAALVERVRLAGEQELHARRAREDAQRALLVVGEEVQALVRGEPAREARASACPGRARAPRPRRSRSARCGAAGRSGSSGASSR